MMKKPISIIAFLFAPFVLLSQFTFEKTIGTIDDDGGYTVVQCEDNGYFIVGYTSNFYFGYPDTYVIKTDVAGDVVWTDIPGEPDRSDRGRAGIQTFDGGYAVCGEEHNDSKDVPFLIKYENNGTIDWTGTYPIQGDYSPRALIQAHDSGFLFCGSVDYDMKTKYWNNYPSVLKTSKTGSVEWRKDIVLEYGYHSINDIALANQFGYVVCGSYDYIGSENEDGLLVKLAANGDQEWHEVMGESLKSENFRSIKRTLQNGYILCGTRTCGTFPPWEKSDVLLVKTDADGNVLWEKQIDTGESEYGYDVDVISDGGYIIAGTVKDSLTNDYNVMLIRTNTFGDTLWTKTFGGEYDDRAYAVCTTNDGGFVICGMTKSFGNGGSDVYLIKTDEYGIMTNTNEHAQLSTNVVCYPNPCRGVLNIEADFSIEKISLFTLRGQKLMTKTIKKKRTSLKLEGGVFSSGLYYLLIEGGGQPITKKIVIK